MSYYGNSSSYDRDRDRDRDRERSDDRSRDRGYRGRDDSRSSGYDRHDSRSGRDESRSGGYDRHNSSNDRHDSRSGRDESRSGGYDRHNSSNDRHDSRSGRDDSRSGGDRHSSRVDRDNRGYRDRESNGSNYRDSNRDESRSGASNPNRDDSRSGASNHYGGSSGDRDRGKSGYENGRGSYRDSSSMDIDNGDRNRNGGRESSTNGSGSHYGPGGGDRSPQDRSGGHGGRDNGRDRYGGGDMSPQDRSGGYGGRDNGRDRYGGGDRRGGGGRDRDRESRGSYGGGGDRRGGGGGRGGYGGRGGHGGGGVAVNPTSCLSNLILVDVLPNFRFFLYGVSCTDRSGKMVDSRRRRQELFFKGLLDKYDGLLSRMDIPEKDMDSIKRGLFFEGSYCFSSRPIPGLEKERLPRCLVSNGVATPDADQTPPPVSENGDTITVMKVDAYLAPTSILENQDQTLPESSVPLALLDGTCESCNNIFPSTDSLMSHCREKGHRPSYAKGDEIPANKEIFLAYCNVALQRALVERMARWGREYIDPKNFTEPYSKQGKKLGVKVFRAYTCEFGLHRPNVGEKQGKTSMTLTVDLRAKLLRTKSVLDALCQGYDPNTYQFDAQRQDEALKQWKNEVVICTYDKKCYSVIDLLFNESPASMPVEGLGMSHAEYFETKKKIPLKYPNAKPLVALLGRNQKTIYLPAELICGNDLEPSLRVQLPTIASFKPFERHTAIEEIKRYLRPGAQKTKGMGGGLLPALGIILGEERMKVPVEVMPLPTIIAAGIQVPDHKCKMWAPCLTSAKFHVNANAVTKLNVVVIYHRDLEYCIDKVYCRLRDLVNNFNALYCFGEKPFCTVRAGDMSEHWGEVERYFKGAKLPPNIFVVDLSKPPRRSASDPAYSTIKQMLSESGYLSQFINFNTYDHGTPREFKKSNIILQGVARQVLSKCGVRIWWVNVPPTLPLPAVFIGVDVFHAPRRYDPKEKRRVAKESVAAVVVQVLRKNNCEESPTVEIYSETARRDAGQEMECGSVLKDAVGRALKELKVNPMSCIVWRDGVGDSTISKAAEQEVPDLRQAFMEHQGSCPTLSYVVCQKRVATKFLTEDGRQGMPVGALINSLQGPEFDTFYINGTSPPYSTPKPVRFVVCNRDPEIDSAALEELTWALCHDYPNWAGPVKLPAPVQMAHKLAELAGGFVDCGESINSRSFTNKIHFL